MSRRGRSGGARRGYALSLGTKLAVATVAVLAVVSSLVFYRLTAHARDTLLESKVKAATLMTDVFAASAMAPLDFGDDTDVANELLNLRVNGDISYAAVWRDGATSPTAVLGDAGTSAPGAPTASTRAETRVLADSLELVRRIERPDGGVLGFAVIRYSLAPEYAALRSQRRGILLGTAGTAAILALLILGIARVQIVSPLDRLVHAARRLETGEAAVRVEVEAGDEIGKLAGAFNAMSEAIRDREAHLADAMGRLRELFDHMRQGILVFGSNGRVEEAPSRQATLLFGPDTAGRSILELLYADASEGSPARQAFEVWLEHAFEVPPDAWAEFAALAPPLVERRHEGQAQWLELQFTPIAQGVRIQRMMLLATDVSDRRRLERAAHTREELHSQQMKVMQRLVAGGGQVFVGFLEAAQRRIVACQDKIGRAGFDGADLVLVFNHVHTIRGEARTFELPELAAECQGLERILRELRDARRAIAPLERGQLRVRLEQARLAVERARALFVEAAPIGQAILDQMTVRRSDVNQLTELLAGSGGVVRRLLSNLTARPFGECVTALQAAAPRWAGEAGKQAQLIVEGREARVPAELAPVLTAVLPHLVRNAIAHGIEKPEVRHRRGKPDIGTLRVSAAECAGSLTVCVCDDGAGIDEDSVRAKAENLGLPAAPAVESVFAPGVSTATGGGELAGQGVGLAAVRAELREVGCDVVVRSEQGHGAAFEIRAIGVAEA